MILFRRMLVVLLSCMLGNPNLRGDEFSSNSIDEQLQAAWSKHGLESAALCSDEQFLRRLTLDLLGRIPTLEERKEFLVDPNRTATINRLLAHDLFTKAWSENLTTQLFGYANDSADRDTLALWIDEQVRNARPYDAMVQELISATGQSAFVGPVNFLLRYPDEPVVKVSRAFLGVRLDCARCHDHPFDRWTQEDFARMNRFFEGMERQEISPGNIRLVDVARETSETDRPRFLTGAEPKTKQWRSEFGLFLIRSRPFARNFANRIWYHLVGRGIVHPIDDVSRDNPASLPELLNALAEEAIQSKFDIRHMIRLICNSKAYQLESFATLGDEERIKYFSISSIKPLTPEQWFDSMCVAMGQVPEPNQKAEFVRTFLGDALDGDFSSTWEYRETIQGLMSRLVESIDPPTSETTELFIRILGREPSADEMANWQTRPARDLCFVLLHSNEFAFNH